MFLFLLLLILWVHWNMYFSSIPSRQRHLFAWKKKINKIKKKKCTLWHYEDYNIFVVFFRQLFFYTVVQRFMCAIVFCSLSLLHSYLYLLLQSIFTHEKNTMYNFKRLVCTFSIDLEEVTVEKCRNLLTKFLMFPLLSRLILTPLSYICIFLRFLN